MADPINKLLGIKSLEEELMEEGSSSAIEMDRPIESINRIDTAEQEEPISFEEPQEPAEGAFVSFEDNSKATDIAILDEGEANYRASMFEFAIPEDSSVDKSNLLRTILDGGEEQIRQTVSAEQMVKYRQLRDEYIQDVIKTSAASGKELDKETIDLVKNVGDEEVIEFIANPSLNIERLFAEKSLTTALANNALKEREDEETDVTTQELLDQSVDWFADRITKSQMLVNMLQNAEAKWSKLSYWQAGKSIGATVLPMWSWSSTKDALKKRPSVSWWPGRNQIEQNFYLWNLPAEEMQREVKRGFEHIWESDPIAALNWLRQIQGYSTDKAHLDNVIQFLDMTSVGSLGYSVAKGGLGTIRGIGGALMKGREIRAAEVAEATGDIAQAARMQAAEMIDPTARLSANELMQDIPSLFNARMFFDDAGSLSLENASRLLADAQRRAKALVTGATDDVVQVQRTGEAALAQAFKEAEELAQLQYSELGDAVLRMRHTTADSTKLNVHTLSIDLGHTNGTLFATYDMARRYADDIYKLDRAGYKVNKHGDYYYLTVTKSVDETSAGVRDLAIDTLHKTSQNNMLKFWTGWAEGADASLSTATNQARKVAVVGTSKLGTLIKDEIKSIGRLTKKEAKRFTKFVQSQRQQQRFNNTAAEFEQEWLKKFGTLPSEKELTHYFTYKQMNDLEYMINNMGIFRDKYIQGIENYKFISSNTNVEGKLVKEIDWNNHDKSGILVITEANGKPTLNYVNKMFASSREKYHKYLEANGLKNSKIVELGLEGEQMLRADPALAKLLPKGRINYVVTPNVKSSPLKLRQIPYKPGGHFAYKEGYYISQPRLNRVVAPDGVVNRTSYMGDNNVYHFIKEADAKRYAMAMDDARILLRDGKLKELATYLKSNLPHTVDSFRKMFKTEKNADGILDINETISYRASGENMADRLGLKDHAINFVDERGGFYTGVNTRYAAERGEMMYTIMRKGDEANPIFNVKPAEMIDPIATMERGLSTLMKSRYFDDVKFIHARDFVEEYHKLMKPSLQELRANPFEALTNPQWKDNITDKVALAHAKNYRNAANRLMNVPGPTEEAIRYSTTKLVKSIFGEGHSVVDPHRIADAVVDMPTKLRSIAFHTKLGLFALPQVVMQAQGMTTAISAGGAKNGFKAFAANFLMTRTNFFKKAPEKFAEFATRFGWTKDQFLESYTWMKKTGWDNVGGEVALRDDFLNPRLFQSRAGAVLDAGAWFFNHGERQTRKSAWNVAYLEWKDANPTRKMTSKEAAKVLNRADNLAANMTAASNAMWQKGALAVPSQFMAYHARMTELFLGRRLSAQDKKRIFITNAVMYGMPNGLGIAGGAVWPINDSMKQWALENGFSAEDGLIENFMMNGAMSLAIESITGQRTNFSDRFGPGGNTVFRDLLFNDKKTVLEALAGVSGTTLAGYVKSSEPFYYSLLSAVGLTKHKYELTNTDLLDMARNLSSVDTATKAWFVYSAGIYKSKNESRYQEVKGEDGLNAGLMQLLGMQSQRIDDAFRMQNSLKARKNYIKIMGKEAIKNLRRGFESNDPDTLQTYIARASHYMELSGMVQSEKDRILTEALKGYEQFVPQIEQKFSTYSPERLDAHLKRLKAREE